ncbi:MAG: PKD domain-containing protein [Vicinamibacterales bacterium]
MKRLLPLLWVLAAAAVFPIGSRVTPGEIVARAAELCVFTKGYWRTHTSWPVASLVLGNPANSRHLYTKSELLGILDAAIKRDASLNLASQLIAAKLNVANGSNPTPIAASLSRADSLLGAFQGKLPYGIAPNSPIGADMTATAGALEDYNRGLAPGSCGPGNRAPVANAGSDQTVTLGALVTLNGSASSDPDSNPLTFTWSFVARPAASAAVLSDATAVMPTFTADAAGTYELRLVVNDGQLDSAPDTVLISTSNSRPTANAGPDQTLAVGSLAHLDASASSDPDGDSLTFQWSFDSKPAASAATLSDPSAINPTFAIDAPGNYVLRLTVSDGVLPSAPDVVTISTINSPPVANAGADATARVGELVTLDGSGSHDVDGDPLTFVWSFVTRPNGSTAALSNTSAINPSFTVDVFGAYVVALVVNDGTVSSPADTVVISTINSPPVAHAGLDQSIFVNVTAQLDGSASSDADGNALTYSWSLTSQPAGSVASLANATSVNPTLVPDVAGTYIAQLIVNDGTTNSDPDVVILTTENRAPVAEAGIAQTVPLGATVQLDGTASNDPDGDSLTFNWALLSAPTGSSAVLADPSGPMPTFVADTRGEYLVQLIVSDGVLSSASDTVTISTENSAPVAVAGGDQTVAVDATVQLDGSASFDPDGTPLDFAWSILSKPPGSAAVLSDPLAINPAFVTDREGLYVVQLIVGDGTLLSAPDTLTVTAETAPLNRPPTAAAGSDSTVQTGVTVVLDGTGSTDPDGDSLSFAWAFVAQPAGSAAVLVDASTATPSFVPDRPGQFVVQLIVTDTHGAASVADEVTITAAAPSRAPLILSSPITDAVVGVLYAYDVSASDPDAGDALTFSLPIAPAGMTVDASGHIRWIPTGSQTGLNNIAVHVRDAFGLLAAQGFSIQVTPGAQNANPTAEDDRYDARSGDSLSVPAPGVLANDADPDGNQLKARALTQPSNGTALLAADGSLVYTPFTFHEGELVLADHVNLAANLPGTTVSASTFSIYSGTDGKPESAIDGSPGTSWLTLGADAANFGPRSRTGALPFIEVTFPESVTVTDLEVVGHRDPSLAGSKIFAGKFQLFDADGAELFDSGVVDLLPPNRDGRVTVPDLFQRSRNIARTMPGAVYRASSFASGFEPALAFDGNLKTEWTNQFFTTPPQFVEAEFPSDVAVQRVRIFGNRSSTSQDFLSFVVQVFDAAGSVLFDSGTINVTADNSDATVEIGGLGGARRVRVTGTSLETAGSRGGISELEIMSAEPSTTRLNSTIRRARFTGTADASFNVGLAEFRVLGSAFIRRQTHVESNLAYLLPTTVRTSSFHSSFRGFANAPENAIDDTVRNWYAVSGAAGEFIELEFPVEVIVNELLTSNPSATPDGFGTSLEMNCSGNFELLATDGTSLFDSGLVNQPSGGINASVTFTLGIPSVTGVKRVRYTSAGCGPSFPPGFSEFRVFGSASVSVPPFAVTKKYQALLDREVHSTPIVANLTDDNGDGLVNQNDVPDIIVVAENPTDQLTGEIKVISGDDGRDLATIGGPNLVSPWSELAVGDIDGDGRPEIIGVHTDGNHLIAFDANGNVKWVSDSHPMPAFNLGSGIATGAVSIANLDAAGPSEIIVGASVFDANGHLLGDGRTLGGTTAGIGLRSAISAVADIDLDGVPELVAGPTAYRLSGGTLSVVWQRVDRLDGYVAIANLDDDPSAEIVVVSNGLVYALNHDGTDAPFWNAPSNMPVPLPGGGQGGAPTIADVDGDGVAEIGVAGAGFYTVFNRDGSIRWKAVISDRTSNATGSTVFDLDGDGSIEVIYRDEAHLRIYRGTDGVLLAKMPIGSSTWSEVPVVADVDNDGHADIVVTTDRFFETTLANTGVFVLQDVANRWVRTRRIWNQHSYHITNINEDGTVPLAETPHWLLRGLNSFRLNALVPDGSEDNTDTFQYVATDGQLDSNIATVHLAVRKPNSAPRITSSGVPMAASDVLYIYAVEAVDPDAGDILTFSLPTAPTGMTIDSASGLIHWTPSGTQLGSHDVVVKVHDARGLFALQGYKIQVGTAVAVPDVIGQSQSAAAALVTAATLNVGRVSTRNSPTVPQDAVISQSPSAGTLVAPSSAVDLVVSIGPAPAGTVPDVVGQQQASAQLDIVAAGFAVGVIDAQFNATVAAGIVLGQNPAGGTQANTGSPINLVVSLGVPPGDRDQDGDGFTGNQGDCNDTDAAIHPGAVDAAGDGIDQNCNGRDSIAGDNTAPSASIDSPVEDAVITMPTDIIGTATDANFLRYTLAVAEVDSTSFTTLAIGSGPVLNGVFGRLDPTLVENGLYRVRLVVEDVNGQTTVADRTYQVAGEAKIGVFTLSFVDLQIPVSGIPITVVRNYDSRVKTPRDFGVGWSLQVKTGKYSNNRRPGDGWTITTAGGPFGLPCTVVNELRSHVTEVRLSDREFYVFRSTPAHIATVAGGCVGSIEFQFVSGSSSGAILRALDNTDFLYSGGDVLTEFDGSIDTGNVVNPTRVRLTTSDGRVIDFDRKAGITRVEDRNANALTITSAGIIHSSGKSIVFERDTQDRIVRMTDPGGMTTRYVYDATGDLVEFIDQTGVSTIYAYNQHHDLLEIRDPLGRPVARQEYDADGRLIGVTDATGERIEMSHDLAASTEVARDRLGNPTVIEYDGTGNVIRRTDALGRISAFTFDTRGNKLTDTDPLNHTTTFTYDLNNKILTKQDPLGRTTTFTYNARGQVLTTTDPLGQVIAKSYDARGNVLTENDAVGSTTTHTYDALGRRLSTRNGIGAVTSYEYTVDGNLRTEIDALGNRKEYTYDANGNRVSEAVFSTGPAGVTRLVTAFAYDAKNRLVATTDPLGQVERVEYDAQNHEVATVDKAGRRTEYVYDVAGVLVARIDPDGLQERYGYDAKDRRTTVTDRQGRTTTTTYDAVDRQVVITRADGTTTETTYDAGDRIIRTTDERGSTIVSTYDAAGQLLQRRDPLGGVTAFEYDANGRRIGAIDPLGRSTRFDYDAAGRLLRTTYADLSTRETGYDAIGRKVSETDQAGNTTRYNYDALNRLVSVTDALGGITTHAYDELGNRIRETDALNQSTTFGYDVLGRVIRIGRPLGMSQRSDYDAAGNLIARTEFDGQITRYRYDLLNRRIETTLPNGTIETFTYTPAGQRATVSDARGLTRYTYDLRDRLVSRDDPGGTALSYVYDGAGNRVADTTPAGTTTYVYDAINRLVRVNDPQGGVTTYGYDAVGNRMAEILPNGSTATYTYDALNRLVAVANRAANASTISSFAYTLGAAGNRLRVDEGSGRSVQYTYDALFRLTSEQVTDPGGNDPTITYSYDAVGNRRSKTSTLTGLTLYTYDANNRLIAEGPVTYTYDLNGNLVGRAGGSALATYSYDSRRRLVAVDDGGSHTEYVYDVDGNRVRAVLNGSATTDFLVDTNRAFAQVIMETSGGTPGAIYVHGDDLISQTRAGTRSFYHYDGQMSTRQLTDATGAITDAYDYDAFGVLLRRTGTTPNQHLYTGEFLDPQSGFYYLRARWLAASQGRFISEDPVAGLLFDPPTLHKYVYALNNPVNRLDPSGKFSLAAVSVSASVSGVLSSIALTHFTFALIEVKILDALFKPGFRYRYGALQILEASSDPDVLMWAYKLYDHGNQLIAIGSGLSEFTSKVLDFAQSFTGLAGTLNSVATAQNNAGRLAGAAAVFADLALLNFKVQDVNSSLNSLGDTLGVNVIDVNVPTLKVEASQLAQGLLGAFKQVLLILASIQR